MRFHDLFIPTQRNNFKAIFLRVESLFIISLLVFTANFYIAKLPPTSAQAQIDINSLVYFHNLERTKIGLGSLSLNSKLIESSTKKAEIMLESDCWDHYCPNGKSPWDFFKDANYNYSHAGENLGHGFSENSILMRAWMNSKTHRENILKPEFEEIGFGFAHGLFQNREDDTIVAVHFGTPPLSEKTEFIAEEIQTTSPQGIQAFPNNVKYDSGIFNTKNILDLGVILFIATLLILDYIVIKKYNLLNTHRQSHHHYKLSLLLVVGLLLLISGGYGNILAGLSI